MRRFITTLILLATAGTFAVAQTEPLPDFLNLFKEHKENMPTEKVFLHLDKSEYAQAETIWIKSYLVAGSEHSLSPLSKNVYVELLTEKGDLVERLTLKSEDGLAKASLLVPRTLDQGFYYLRAYTNWMRNQDQAFFFNKKIRILSTNEDEIAPVETITARPDLQFYPEGGELVKGIPSKVAFEITGLDLKGKPVKGQVLNGKGEVVKEFKTQHEGRGLLAFVPTEVRYTARLEGVDQVFDLPRVNEFGQVLTVNNLRPDYLTANIKSVNESKEPFYLIAHTRGYVTYASQITLTGARGFMKIDKSNFPTGISHITLFNKYMEPIAERLVFIDQQKELNVKVNTNKQQYENRELATVGIKVTDAEGKPVQGSFSMSVFNSGLAKNDQLDQNIQANLLLSSDLPGYITNPSQYFDGSLGAKENLDLLMMVNGWRRFSWVDIRDQAQMLYPVETGLTLEGNVEKSRGGIVKDGKVLLVNANDVGNGSQYVLTDEKGRFTFTNLDYSDTTFLRFQGFHKGAAKNVKINLETALADPLPLRNTYTDPNAVYNPLQAQEYKQFAQRVIYIDSTWRRANGITYLGTVSVEAERREKNRAVKSQYGPGDAYVNYADIPFEKKAGRDPYQMLNGRVGGFQMQPATSSNSGQGLNVLDPVSTNYNPLINNVVNNDPIFRPPTLRQGMNSGTPVVLLDNIPVPWDLIYSLQATEIDYVEIYKNGNANMFGARGFSGAIAFYTLKGEQYFRQFPKQGLLYTKANGYHTAREFYAPRYDTRRRQRYIPDRRATLLWEPMITTDENGEAMVNFFTPDDTGNIIIDVQGLSFKGQTGVGSTGFSIRSNF